MNVLNRYKSIVAATVSDIHSHRPVDNLGRYLGAEERVQFDSLQNYSRMFVMTRKPTEEILLDITDLINILPDSCGSMDLLSEFVEFLRIMLLSGKPVKVHRSIKICDTMLKNCGSIVYILLGQHRFLYTLSKVSRWWLLQSPGREHSLQVALYGLDCVQAWGEAFEPRRKLYPHYYDIYMQLRAKDYVRFVRPQYDCTRVPIFLGPISKRERDLVATHQQKQMEQLQDQLLQQQQQQQREDDDLELALAASTLSPQYTQDRKQDNMELSWNWSNYNEDIKPSVPADKDHENNINECKEGALLETNETGGINTNPLYSTHYLMIYRNILGKILTLKSSYCPALPPPPPPMYHNQQRRREKLSSLTSFPSCDNLLDLETVVPITPSLSEVAPFPHQYNTSQALSGLSSETMTNIAPGVNLVVDNSSYNDIPANNSITAHFQPPPPPPRARPPLPPHHISSSYSQNKPLPTARDASVHSWQHVQGSSDDHIRSPEAASANSSNTLLSQEASDLKSQMMSQISTKIDRSSQGYPPAIPLSRNTKTNLTPVSPQFPKPIVERNLPIIHSTSNSMEIDHEIVLSSSPLLEDWTLLKHTSGDKADEGGGQNTSCDSPSCDAADTTKSATPSLHLPSSDCRNEYAMYGNQRVVIRRCGHE